MIKGKLIAVNISEKKGVSKTPVEFGVLVEDFGIEGDSHTHGNQSRDSAND